MTIAQKSVLLAVCTFLGTWLVFLGTESLWAHAQKSQSTDEGARLYQRDCAACHGVVGDGAGKLAGTVASLVPRNFREEPFRFISTENGIAFREDILRTIRRGIPEVGMPPALLCSPEEQEVLADYVMGLHQQGSPDEDAPGAQWKFPSPQGNGQTLEESQAVFTANCSVCHGPDGTAKNAPAFSDSLGRLVKPRDLTVGDFYGGATDLDLYWRIRCGIPGTVMPAFSKEQLTDVQVLGLIQYLRSLSE